MSCFPSSQISLLSLRHKDSIEVVDDACLLVYWDLAERSNIIRKINTLPYEVVKCYLLIQSSRTISLVSWLKVTDISVTISDCIGRTVK